MPTRSTRSLTEHSSSRTASRIWRRVGSAITSRIAREAVMCLVYGIPYIRSNISTRSGHDAAGAGAELHAVARRVRLGRGPVAGTAVRARQPRRAGLVGRRHRELAESHRSG